MVILSHQFKEWTPADKRAKVAQYMRNDGFIKDHDGNWCSAPNFLFIGNGKLYIKKAIEHCEHVFDDLDDSYLDENNDYQEYLRNL